MGKTFPLHVKATVFRCAGQKAAGLGRQTVFLMRLGDAWDAIMTSLTGKTTDSGTAIAKTLDVLGKIFMFVFDYMIFSITTFITIFADVFSSCIMIASDLIALIKNVFMGNWSAAWNNITDIFIHAFDGIKMFLLM